MTPVPKVTQVIQNSGFDAKSAAAQTGGSTDTIVYEQFGSLNVMDLEIGQESAGRRNYQRRHRLGSTEIRKRSPAGSAMHLSRRLACVPYSKPGVTSDRSGGKGDAKSHKLAGVAERDPSWSRTVNGSPTFWMIREYASLTEENGMGDVRKIRSLGDPPSYFYSPTWSPDSKKIAYTDKRLNLWYVDIDKERR